MCSSRSTIAMSMSSWDRAHRSTLSTTSMPTISTMAAWDSSAARRSPSARSVCRAVRSAPRLTYDWRRPNELARVEFMMQKMEELGRTMGAAHVWRSPLGPGAPGAHHEGGTRMGNDPKTSVVNRYGQSWDIPNLFIIGSSTFPSMSGFNPTLTIQALAYMSADAIVNRYRKNPGPLL